jgi:pimeloyl-ACP methyl ester carboxylesterase
VLVDMTPDVRFEGAKRVFDFVTAPAELASVEDFVERAMEFQPEPRPATAAAQLVAQPQDSSPTEDGPGRYDRRHMTRARFDGLREQVGRLWELIGKVTCPTLVVRGERSDVVTAESAKALAEALPEANGRQSPARATPCRATTPWPR